jgi:hypothetical protein
MQCTPVVRVVDRSSNPALQRKFKTNVEAKPCYMNLHRLKGCHNGSQITSLRRYGCPKAIGAKIHILSNMSFAIAYPIHISSSYLLFLFVVVAIHMTS